MKEPVVAGRKPILVQVEKGKVYLWCSCGRSARQPFCDGSHVGSAFLPLRWEANESGEHLLCVCKRTQGPPFCDGSHNNLSETYATSDGQDHLDTREVEFVATRDGNSIARLDDTCYVLRPRVAPQTGFTLIPTIDQAYGARHLSLYHGQLHERHSPAISFGDRDVVLFVLGGSGSIEIGNRSFPLTLHGGVCIKPGEAFQLHRAPAQPLIVNMAVCPLGAPPAFPAQLSDRFDERFPLRAVELDEGKREPMADRFFQVLVDKESHQTPVTQFIGDIPQSRAAHHRHIYEEALTVLSGEGYMWTDLTKAAVRPSDVIFLPIKQSHSLECTSADGMRLFGAFFPSMSPAVNY